MNFFKKIFGKKDENNNPSQKESSKYQQETLKILEEKVKEQLPSLSEQQKELFEKMMEKVSNNGNTPELFKKELYNSLERYYSSPGLEFELNLIDKKGKIYAEHEAFDYTYNQWKQITSTWDRRSILFEHWDSTEFKNLQKWQVIERFVKDRYALKALDFQKQNITNDDLEDIRLFVALSKLNRALDSFKSALHYSQTAYELRPDLDIVKVEYATVLHLSDIEKDKELSHKLINEVIENKLIKDKQDKAEIPLLNYFIFSTDYIDSSIFVLNYLKLGNCDLETWDKIAEEYYWCPIFRYEHSVILSNNGEGIRALAKLNSLADEFPWFKKGVLANIDAINQVRIQKKDSNFMEKEMKKMEQYKSMWKN